VFHRGPLLRAARLASLLLALALPLAGCDTLNRIFGLPVTDRGHKVSEEQLAEITPGVQTRADVQALLGSPTQTSTFSNDTWYYISAKTKVRPARALELLDQETVVIEFDGRGVVREVRRVGQDQMRSVAMVSRETPVPGSDRTFLQALFGNVGRFNPAGSQAGAGQAGSAASSAGAVTR
jgi:outer membrane protein assembly factor BamE (lipoprotein component of BamABCDE complex)